ncbi:MmgE/PrpD family protein [Corynebacterium comes]|uniref:MmgE/PrpD family protein n=1 Tax=Corynebacterium comes TaxID=2675218 RepID=A0A6B8W065_9CORY|nr:MmgE/PrpD family protein [Corynebacterium comes]QGU05871.1 MmgE/PrpD family protein [Corynebacterium comes]
MTTTPALEVRTLAPEQQLGQFVTDFQGEEIPPEVRQVVRSVIRTIFGTMVAGADQDGIAELRSYLLRQGGVPEARSIIFGDHLPAVNAALFNGTMARALDYCDLMVPGLHLGSSVIPAALAAAELKGPCTGAEFETAVLVGLEVGASLNLTEEQFDGFDPTGVVGVFAATASAARLLELSEEETINALGLAFNRSAGSFQSNTDASLAVRLIQGFAASNAIQCVQLAQLGFTGPENFLAGRFGYAHLWGRDQVEAEDLVAGLGTEWKIINDFFKKYPCCGLAQGPTDLAFRSIRALDITADDIEAIDLYLPEFAFNLIGQRFEPGSNPRVNAQFSAQYCIVNAIVRGESRLADFEPTAVAELVDHPLHERVRVHHDPMISGHSATRFLLRTFAGEIWAEFLPIGPGYPGNPLTEAEHAGGFQDCLDYAPYPLEPSQQETLEAAILDIRSVADINEVINALMSQHTPE